MMKKVLLVLAVIVAIIVAAGLLAPKDFKLEREVTINQPKDVVFNYLKFLKNEDQWSPWAKKDPDMVKTYRGEDGKVGFVSAWSGNKEVGVGEQEIKSIEEGKRIDFELRFKKPMEDTAKVYLITESVGDVQTKVKWGFEGQSSFPGNIICLVVNMKAKLGKDYEEGLAGLKTILETEAAKAVSGNEDIE